MIAIVDYKAGNLTSVRLAFERLDIPAIVTQTPADILKADRVVFPGVGSAGAAMQTLSELGLEQILREVVDRGTPFLGICLGAQIICERSEEDGGTSCLGLVRGQVCRFQPGSQSDKVPQMGWNNVRWTNVHPLFEGVESGSEFYFVHSYYPAPSNPAHVLGETDYAGIAFASVIGFRNLIATQFHPEKSGNIGLRLLKNFSQWNGLC